MFKVKFSVVSILLFIVCAVGIVRAQNNTINIPFDDDTYGKVSQSLGLLGSGITAQNAQELVSAFSQTPIYIKLVNPNAASITAPQFQTIANAGHKWYFLFTQNTSVTSVLDAYKATHPLTNLVIELETVDAAFIQTLKTNYPGIRIHTGNLPIWPRSRVNEIYGIVQPPIIEGVSFWIADMNEGGVFNDIKLTYDTFFDASKAIAGEKVNHPANSILSVSEVRYDTFDDQRETAYLSGVVSSTILTSVQSQGRGGEAPIRYVFPGKYTELTQQERMLMKHYAQFMANQPDIVWPEAISNNGDPWDNSFLSGGDTKPIVGVIGKIPSGFYGFLTNTSEQQVFANLANRINFSTHQAVSILHGSIVSPNNGTFGIAAHDTVVIYPNNLPNITPPTGTTITPPGQVTATSAQGQPTATSVPAVSCDVQKKQGNFNCSGVIDEADFTAWKESYAAKSTSLVFFEYWRRAFVQ